MKGYYLGLLPQQTVVLLFETLLWLMPSLQQKSQKADAKSDTKLQVDYF